MRTIVVTCLLAAAACSPRGNQQAILVGAWTWDGVDCAERRYEFTDDSIRAVLPNENAIMYKILKTYVSETKPPEVVLDLQLLPQRGMSPEALQFLKNTGGFHSMSFEVDGNRIRPLTMSMTRKSAPILPGEPTYDEWSLHRCPTGRTG